MKSQIYWKHLNRFLFFVLLSAIIIAQEGEVIEISKDIGYTLDAEENLHYEVFKDIPNFESAQFFEVSRNRVVARISFIEYTLLKVSKRAFDLKEFSDLQLRLRQTPKITDEIRESFRKNLTYLRTKSVLENIPTGQYLEVKNRKGQWVRGTLLRFNKNRLLIQTPISIKQVPMNKMRLIKYREQIIRKPEWKLNIYGLAAILGVGLMETWNRQTSPDWGYKWHNRFIGATLGLVAGAEAYDTSMILLTKKTQFGLTPEELDKLNR